MLLRYPYMDVYIIIIIGVTCFTMYYINFLYHHQAWSGMHPAYISPFRAGRYSQRIYVYPLYAHHLNNLTAMITCPIRFVFGCVNVFFLCVYRAPIASFSSSCTCRVRLRCTEPTQPLILDYIMYVFWTEHRCEPRREAPNEYP